MAQPEAELTKRLKLNIPAVLHGAHKGDVRDVEEAKMVEEITVFLEEGFS